MERRAHGPCPPVPARQEGAQHAPRSGHGVFEAAPDRPDVVGVLEHRSATRVPGLVPIRYGGMLESPFFYRGAAAVMAADLGALPGAEPRSSCAGTPVC